MDAWIQRQNGIFRGGMLYILPGFWICSQRPYNGHRGACKFMYSDILSFFDGWV